MAYQMDPIRISIAGWQSLRAPKLFSASDSEFTMDTNSRMRLTRIAASLFYGFGNKFDAFARDFIVLYTPLCL